MQWEGKTQPAQDRDITASLTEIFDPRRSVTPPTHLSFTALQKSWHNLLFRGDNSLILDYLLAHGFREAIDFIYIDPPFNTGSEYVRNIRLRGTTEGRVLLQQTAYHDTWDTSVYLQFMYERLFKIRTLMKSTGFLCVHLDYHVGHYLKILLDELFGQENFRNEIIVKRVYKNLQRQFAAVKSFPQGHDVIYCYSKEPQTRFKPATVQKEHQVHPEGYWKEFWSGADRPTMRYPILGITPAAGQWKWKNTRAQQAVDNYLEFLKNQTENSSLYGYWMQTGCEKEFIRKSSTGRIEHWVPPSAYKFLDTVWSDIASYSFDHGFKTEKNENLLERLLSAFSRPDDLVLDVFAGSGTTVRVAQKLGRRWIACDAHPSAVQLTSRTLQQVICDQQQSEAIPHHAFMTYHVKTLSGDRKTGRARHSTMKMELSVKRIKVHAARVSIDGFRFPKLEKNIGYQGTKKKKNDFRSMIDAVIIDPDYDGKVFYGTYADAPKKHTMIQGAYTINVRHFPAMIAVKIVAVNGEEILFVREV